VLNTAESETTFARKEKKKEKGKAMDVITGNERSPEMTSRDGSGKTCGSFTKIAQTRENETRKKKVNTI